MSIANDTDGDPQVLEYFIYYSHGKPGRARGPGAGRIWLSVIIDYSPVDVKNCPFHSAISNFQFAFFILI